MARSRRKSVTRKPKLGKAAQAAGRKAAVPRAAPPSEIRMVRLGANAAPRGVGAKAPNTVIYIHGIYNKPPASVLKCQWDKALFGHDLGDRSRMAYWVNRDYYPKPLDETCAGGDLVEIEDDEITTRAVMALARGQGDGEGQAVANEIRALTDDPVRQAWLARVAAKAITSSEVPESDMQVAEVRAKVLPVPAFLRRLIVSKITRAFLRDVNDFFFVEERRKAMEQALLDRIAAGGGPFVVIAHSQGSMIAYDVLRQLDAAQCDVQLFVTIGSPLGLQEVQDVLRQWTGTRGRLPFPRCVKRWINVADRLDPVAFDGDISNDFEGNIENPRPRIGLNPDSPRHPHSATGYLRTDEVQLPVHQTVGSSFRQPLTRFGIAKDLVAELEDAFRETRRPTLIQLTDDNARRPADNGRQLADLRARVSDRIVEIIRAAGGNPEDAGLDHLRHFIAAKLTRLEVETLRSEFEGLQIAGIWRNAPKRALIHASTHTIQARPANLGYGADGNGICWAVLDTGIRADHPHFKEYDNVKAQWDCTRPGAPVQLARGSAEFNGLDRQGHGTHVAATIAGSLQVNGTLYAGMAPRCALYGFKVLDDRGRGDDAWVIKALDAISEINEKAGALVIHGVNLSLGGNFDPEVFGCGHTPLCQELRRLWRQGVLVCLAAGNEGYAVLQSTSGAIPSNLDLSIGDPANLEEAIAVGSVHKTNPHTYGISFFSSRGPTADGRRKPDVVAPGERILSARHDWPTRKAAANLTRDDLYVDMSGTSMATPHVSGLLAAFLSLRREFIGYPDRVKSLLLNSCVDLGRDPYMQGFGLPNLIKLLALN